MTGSDAFLQTIQAGYTFKGPAIPLGVGMLDGQPVPNALISAPLSTINRHGLVAGATGTGKTQTGLLYTSDAADDPLC